MSLAGKGPHGQPLLARKEEGGGCFSVLGVQSSEDDTYGKWRSGTHAYSNSVVGNMNCKLEATSSLSLF